MSLFLLLHLLTTFLLLSSITTAACIVFLCLTLTLLSFIIPPYPLHILNISSCSPLPPQLRCPLFCSWRCPWRGGAASAVLFLRTVLLVQNTDGYYGAAHKLIMLEINCCCQRQPPTCPSVSLCPLMHRIQLMDQMFAQCAASFKVSTKVVWGISDLHLFVLSVCALLALWGGKMRIFQCRLWQCYSGLSIYYTKYLDLIQYQI